MLLDCILLSAMSFQACAVCGSRAVQPNQKNPGVHRYRHRVPDILFNRCRCRRFLFKEIRRFYRLSNFSKIGFFYF